MVTKGQTIPTRTIVIHNENEMPNNYSTTPGGTIFGTTPGGTKIVYERAFLLQMRDCVLAQTPPTNLPIIPGVTNVGRTTESQEKEKPDNNNCNGDDADDQFAMDI
jgi:hypothetical protein